MRFPSEARPFAVVTDAGQSGGMAGPHHEGNVLVCIPTYDERETLPVLVGRLRVAVPSAHILIVDDASPDGTGEVADQLAADDGAVTVVHRPAKEGLGAAYVAAFSWALDHGYDVIVEMDADCSHQPEQLPTLLAALTDADVVLGSRWVPGGAVENWPRTRLLLSRGGNTYTRLMLGLSVADSTGGFRAYRAAFLKSIPLDGISSQGYCFQVDLVWRAARGGFRIVEIPITFVERTAGYSKMSRSIVLEALWKVTRWGLSARLRPSASRGR